MIIPNHRNTNRNYLRDSAIIVTSDSKIKVFNAGWANILLFSNVSSFWVKGKQSFKLKNWGFKKKKRSEKIYFT